MSRKTAPSTPPTQAASPPEVRKGVVRRLAVAAAVVLAAGLLAACDGEEEPVEATPVGGSTTEDAAPETAAPETSAPEQPETFTMPALEGMVLQDAQDTLQALGSYVLDQQDASGMDRMQIDDSNWFVCSQEPATGTEVSLESVVVLASVKLDETCPEGAAGVVGEPDEAAEEPEAEQPDMTASQEQAVRKAESYLDFSAFSKKGLIEQLEFEGFSEEDATFAVEHLSVDWNEQAKSKADSYLDYSAFSKKGLVEQLEFEGFSTKQAEFAVENITVDWMEQAAKKAQDYLDYSAFSRSGLIDQLVFEGFTKKQAEYGADAVGL